jgi:tetratricopeptide (TPR) repeat protein
MRTKSITILVVTFTLGIAVGAFAARKGVDSNIYRGKSKQDAAQSLLELARTQAGKGSWENIAVGRALYVGGMKEEGQAIFDSITSKKPEPSDWMRIGRAYYDAGDWDKAKAAFDKTLEKSSKDAAWLAEIGAYYNLKGDRAKAEELFEKSFAAESGELWHTVNMAGSYVGVEPLR